MCHDQDRVLKEYIEVQCDIRCQVSVCNFSFLSVHISRYTEYYKRCSSYVETFELVDGGNQALNDVKVRLPAGVPIPELVLLARRELVRRDFLNLIVRHAIEYPRVQLVDVSPPPVVVVVVVGPLYLNFVNPFTGLPLPTAGIDLSPMQPLNRTSLNAELSESTWISSGLLAP